MSKEQNLQTVANYDFSNVPNFQTALNFVDSLNKETNRQPDNFFYWIDQNGLVDPATGMYLHDIFTPDSHPIPYLGEAEYSVVLQLDELSKAESGYMFWLSPELKIPEGYPGNGLEIMKISKSPAGQKKTENTALRFDCSSKVCLQIAKEMFQNEFGEAKDLELVRRQVVYRDANFDITSIIQKIVNYIPKNENYTPMAEGDRYYLAGLIMDRTGSWFIAQEMSRKNALGEFLIGCPSASNGSFSNTLVNRSFIINFGVEGKFVRNCGNCGTPINTVISRGYRCSKCGGIYEGC